MTATQAAEVNPTVTVSVPMLVRLSRFAPGVSLRSGQILARQSGDYQSPFKGRGMEFDESRLYQPGDDIRNIDWRVTARTGKTHTKLFREERERPVFVWVDLRRSMFFATRGRFKAVIGAHLAGLLAWAANRHGDRVGGVIFSEEAHHEFKPRRGKSGVLHLINQLAGHPAWRQPPGTVTPVPGAGGVALARLQQVARPGSLIFLLSDFRDLDGTAITRISRLSRHNDVVMIHIHDRLERDLPPAGHYRMSDGAAEVLLDTFDRVLVTAHRRRFQERLEQLRGLARKHGINLLSCGTEDDPLEVLKQGL